MVTAYGQRQANWWYFGNHAGLDFTLGSATGVANGALRTTEGCATISDPNTGQLQFYTDGTSVWNRNHTLMPNGTGLMGHSSSSHSAIIVPFPSNPNRYYLFTVPTMPSGGARYSIVDMSFAGGLGDVVINSKNRPLSSIPVPDKIAAVRHANGRDFWVVIQHNTTWDLYAYLIDSRGVSTTPVITPISAPVLGPVGHIGCIKFSPDGSQLATFSSNRVLTLANFNAGTGTFTQIRHNQGVPGTGYGIEFSANSRVLYAGNTQDIYQFDTQAGTASQIWASRVKIPGPGSVSIGQLQLGLDRKIYLAQMTSRQLGVIHFPDRLGLACTFSPNGVSIPGTAQSQYGLPTFVQSFLDVPEILIKGACENGFTTVSIVNPNSADSVYYDYGDTLSGVNNYSTHAIDSHQYNQAGPYLITAIAWYTVNGQVVVDTFRQMVQITPIPQLNVTQDTLFCREDSICISVLNTSAYSVLWMDSSTSSCLTIDTAGAYWVEAINECGVSRDTVHVDSLFQRSLDLGPDLPLCPSDTVELVIRDTMGNYLWSTQETDSLIQITQAGTYWALSNNQCGLKSDTIRVYDLDPPEVDLGGDTAFCGGTWYVLDAHWPGSSYLWHDGNRHNYRHWARTTGLKWVEVTNACGVASDSAYIEVHHPLFFDLGPDSVLCEGDSIHLKPFIGFGNILWSDSSSEKTIQIKKPGTWWLQVTNLCGSRSDTIHFRNESAPEVVFPSDTVLCMGEGLTLSLDSPSTAFAWSTGDTGYSIYVQNPGLYWGKTANECGIASDSLQVYVDVPLKPTLGSDTTLCEGQQFSMGFQFPNNPGYLWNTGETSSHIQVASEGVYSVTISNACGPYTAHRRVDPYYKPVIEIGADTILCFGKSLLLKSGLSMADMKYTDLVWNGSYANKEWVAAESGEHFLEATNRCGTARDTMVLSYFDPIHPHLPEDTGRCEEIILPTWHPEGHRYYWFHNGDSIADELRSYRYTLVDNHGCQQEFSLELVDCPYQFYSPSAFTPNSDPHNPTFKVYLTGGYDYHLTVLNRWNEVVFESYETEQGWDGIRQDNETHCPDGVYVWKLSFRNDFDDQLIHQTGQVTLYR
ncbi:gliding motility-associated C-terminal domain-containing protein [bacterium SCSIO 12741]|nr:gliding motility-associated C-terminal domain-containing protein [bacterium SCSIO 12741]